MSKLEKTHAEREALRETVRKTVDGHKIRVRDKIEDCFDGIIGTDQTAHAAHVAFEDLHDRLIDAVLYGEYMTRQIHDYAREVRILKAERDAADAEVARLQSNLRNTQMHMVEERRGRISAKNKLVRAWEERDNFENALCEIKRIITEEYE